MIDFTNEKELICNYGGSKKKKKINYKEDNYLLKFPNPIIKNNKIFYMNNVYSKYLRCKAAKYLKN